MVAAGLPGWFCGVSQSRCIGSFSPIDYIKTLAKQWPETILVFSNVDKAPRVPTDSGKGLEHQCDRKSDVQTMLKKKKSYTIPA